MDSCVSRRRDNTRKNGGGQSCTRSGLKYGIHRKKGTHRAFSKLNPKERYQYSWFLLGVFLVPFWVPSPAGGGNQNKTKTNAWTALKHREHPKEKKQKRKSGKPVKNCYSCANRYLTRPYRCYTGITCFRQPWCKHRPAQENSRLIWNTSRTK